MIYFTLPQSPLNIFHNIHIEEIPQMPPIFLSQSLCNYMNDIKEQISSKEKEWDVYKKYTNPYEYIHSVVPQKKKSVSKYKPISRSYFKMLEMMAEFNLDKPALPYLSKTRTQEFKMHCDMKNDALNTTCKQNARRGFIFETPPATAAMRTFHLAEGPGGFIEAICNKRNNPIDEYYGMTIILDEMDDNVPAWHKTVHFLSQNPNVNIEYGIDGTGNLLHIENFEHCVRKYGGSMDLITADGGFDFSKDFNRQEVSITNLLWGQACYALCLQKQGGNFILKIFDIFYEHTVHILYILAAFYEEVHICKLKTSRIGNSEKYLVCRNFRHSSYVEFYPFIHKSFLKIKHFTKNLEPIHAGNWFYIQHSYSTDNEEGFTENDLQLNDNAKKQRTHFEHTITPHNMTSSYNNDACIPSNPNVNRYNISSNSIDIFAKESYFNTQQTASSYICKILKCSIPRHFTKQIEDINAIFGQQQIENIYYTLSLIDKQPKQDRLDLLVKQNITKCTNWCIEHSILYNNLVTTNVFAKNSARESVGVRG